MMLCKVISILLRMTQHFPLILFLLTLLDTYYDNSIQWRSQPSSDARAQIFYSQCNYMSRRWAHFREGPKNHAHTV